MAADRLRAMGWKPEIELRDGLSQTYKWFLEQLKEERQVKGISV